MQKNDEKVYLKMEYVNRRISNGFSSDRRYIQYLNNFMPAQLPDKIIFNGVYHDLYSNPLEHYWIRNNKKRPPFNITPDCARGYVASWEINNNQLLLKAIKGEYRKWHVLFGREAEQFTIKNLFPKAKNRAVKASWFSGKIRIPQGNMTSYDDHGYDSRFEKEIIISVEKGMVVKTVMIDYHKRVLTNDPKGMFEIKNQRLQSGRSL